MIQELVSHPILEYMKKTLRVMSQGKGSHEAVFVVRIVKIMFYSSRNFPSQLLLGIKKFLSKDKLKN